MNTHASEKLKRMEDANDLRIGPIVIKAKGDYFQKHIGWILPGGIFVQDRKLAVEALHNLVSRVQK